MLEAKTIICQRGTKALFAPVSFALHSGQALWLRGANGMGKTTLLRTLCGLTQAGHGQVLWQGNNIHASSDTFEAYCATLLYLGHANAVKDDLTPLENLLCLEPNASTAQARLALQELGLAAHTQLACKHLSQGQKRRVALARLSFSHQTLWLLDEPFVALDDAALAWLVQRLTRHVLAGGLLVYTSHQAVDLCMTHGVILNLQTAVPQAKPRHQRPAALPQHSTSNGVQHA
jgi:heme exporter protein A